MGELYSDRLARFKRNQELQLRKDVRKLVGKLVRLLDDYEYADVWRKLKREFNN